MNFHTLKWIGGVSGYLELIDQRKLPGEFVMMDCKTPEEIWDAIKTLAVRGAPAIGVTAGYGVVIGLGKLSGGETIEEAVGVLEEASAYLATSRPTAVNLFWALQRVEAKAKSLISSGEVDNVVTLKEAVLLEAHADRKSVV